MNYIDQVAPLDFDIKDPFDNKEFYFEELRSILPADQFEQLVVAANLEIYGMIHFREYCSSIKYELLSNRVADPTAKEYFAQMSIEEKKHTDVLELIYRKMTGHMPNKDISVTLPNIIESVEQLSEIESTILFFSSELKLIIIFGQIYKTCDNEEKKKFLAEFVAEESQHVNQIAELVVKMAETASEVDKQKAYDTYIRTITGENHFFLKVAKAFLQDLNYDNSVLNIVDTSAWTQYYITKLLNRSYPVLKALKQDLDYDEFVSRRWI